MVWVLRIFTGGLVLLSTRMLEPCAVRVPCVVRIDIQPCATFEKNVTDVA